MNTCDIKGRRKCIQHFIQHCKFWMLDEMLDALRAYKIYKKRKKKTKIVLDDVG